MAGTAIETSPMLSVQGRHRNRALAGRRRVRALQLVSEGLTYQRVADELGYANKGTVHHLVQQELGAQLVESMDELRQTEVARLDALQVVLWDRAMSGDLQAVKVIAGIIMARCRVLALLSTTRPEVKGASDNCGPRTLVISPTYRNARGRAVVAVGRSAPAPAALAGLLGMHG